MQEESYSAQKWCGGCDLRKPTDAFHRDASRPDGLHARCKDCRLAWRQSNPEKTSKSYRKWRAENPERVAATSRAYREAHKERITRREKAYREANRERAAQTGKVWRDKNKSRRDEVRRRWEENNPDRARAKVLIANHKRRTDNGSFTAEEWNALCVKYENRCLCCGQAGILMTVDHVVPISAGGSNSISNIQPLCRRCNSRKKNQIIDYRPSEQLPLI
jgi:5-methylcytosine-specific restriction endonuclease McrA